MQMPDFINYRYIAIAPEPYSAHWIEPKGRLRQASREEVEALGTTALEPITSPETIGLNYQGPHPLQLFRVSRTA
jgi:hypothetical protein